MPTLPRPRPTLPTLALVDAFVGAVAVVLILVVLSSGEAPLEGQRTAADIEIGCASDMAVLPDGRHVTPEALAPALDGAVPPERLSVRVRIAVAPAAAPCAAGLMQRVEAAGRSADRAGLRQPVLLLDIGFEPGPGDSAGQGRRP